MDTYPGVVSPPAFLADFSLVEVLPVAFLVVFVVWAVYTAIAAYHWVRFGHESWAAVPALLTHAVVSLWIMFFAISGIM